MPELIMMIGLPASGKSTYAKELEQEGYHVHSSDAIRIELCGSLNWDPRINGKVFQTLHNRIKEDLKNGISCVYDATNLIRKRRMAFLQEIANIPCKKIAYFALTPVMECEKRNAAREASVPSYAYGRLLRTIQIPAKYEGWDEVRIRLAGKFVGREVEEYPDLTVKLPNELMDFSQDNPHHTETLGSHMRLAEEYAVKHKMPRYIMLAARFHDCGKVYTKAFRDAKGNPSEEAHFYNHENVGAYMYLLAALSEYHYLYPNETEESRKKYDNACYVAQLIEWHMRPFAAWDASEKAKQKDIQMIGEKMYEDIMMLHEADLAAH